MPKNALVKQLNNPGPGLVLALGLLLVAAKLLLAGAQNPLLWPDGGELDDMMMYDGAVSITKGEWLGAYGWKTLSKQTLFSVWLAGLHAVGMPVLWGGQLLWALAALGAAAAFAPLFKTRWAKLGLFAVLLFSPSSTANPASLAGDAAEPLGFVTRIYRDNIFPALCLLCVAGMVGFALRHAQKLRRSLWWLALAGLALAACWLCREDGWWLLPFVVFAALAAGVYLWRGGRGRGQRLVRCAALLLPFALLAAGLLGWCAANQAAYGRFILSDFSGGEFADAYGAMTRVEHENWNPKVDVPRDVREKLYARVPALAELAPVLEGDEFLEKYAGGGDYSSGAFYWALRHAAAKAGHYASPESARAYFAGLAGDINALCDEGALAAGPRRSSVNPPLKAAYIGPVLAEGLYSIGFCAVFAQCEPYSLYSPGGNDAAYYAEKIAPMEEYLHQKALTATMENSTEPYYSLYQRAAFGLLEAFRWLYAIATPVALLAALGWQLWAGARLYGGLRKSKKDPEGWLCWLVVLGLWLCVFLRAFMVAFVTVSSFNIGTYVMYLASIHPLMLLAGYVGAGRLIALLRRRKRRARAWPIC